MTKNILLLESSAGICSVALFDVVSRNLSLRESAIPYNHAVEMGVFVKELLDENEIDPSELAAVAVSEGPGSYTGLRIGASLAKGICYGSNIPLIAVSSLASLASVTLKLNESGVLTIPDPENTVLVALTDARRMEVYRAVYDMNLNCLLEPEAHVLSEESFDNFLSTGKTLVLVGDGAAKTYNILKDKQDKIILTDILPTAGGMSRIASRALEEKQFVDTAYWEPRYLKEFVAKQSTNKLF